MAAGPPPTKGIRHVALFVRDMGVMERFYRERGDTAQARSQYERCLAEAREMGFRLRIDDCERALAELGQPGA